MEKKGGWGGGGFYRIRSINHFAFVSNFATLRFGITLADFLYKRLDILQNTSFFVKHSSSGALSPLIICPRNCGMYENYTVPIKPL